MLIACVDGLKGFPEAIASIFPQTQVQTCVVHQIRNSLRWSLYYVSSSSISEKDKKAFMADLKLVYQALTREEGYENLMKLEEKWGKKYPVPISSRYSNWEHLSTFFHYDAHIRKVIYTTNIVEGFHRQVRKVTKTDPRSSPGLRSKGAFTSDNALLKLVYLVLQRITEKWTMPGPAHSEHRRSAQLELDFVSTLYYV